MFERFTREARAVVIEAQVLARSWTDGEIRAEHLLGALASRTDTAAGELLAVHRLDPAALSEELRRARRRGGLSDADSAALRQFGIDVDEVVERVESVHGRGALDRSSSRRRRWSFAQRSDAGHVPFATESKRVLERSLREAQVLGDNHIGTEHLLLALSRRATVASDVLRRHGLSHDGIRRQLSQLRPREAS
ncbi:MAG: Clp protease N-terminal domain-containing protein [Sciscionella sp.]